MSLTGRTYLLAALVALLGVVEQWAGPDVLLWRVAAAVLVAALLYEWLRVRTTPFRAAPVVPGRLALGRRAELGVHLVNDAARDLDVLFAPDLPASFDCSSQPRRLVVPAGGDLVSEVAVRPLALGVHAWNGVPVRLRGGLGLGWWPLRQHFDAQLEVIPDLLRAPASTTGSAERGGLHRAVAGSGAELHHLREYRPGDPRHTIDWKATARTGTLVTRIYGEDQHLEIVVLVDAGRTSATRVSGMSQLGHYVNAAARFVEHAAAVEDRVGVVAVADRLLASAPPQRGMTGVLRVRRVLGGLEPRAVETDLLGGVMEVQRLVRHRALVVVLTDLYGQDTGGRLAESVRLLLPRHLPVVVGLVGEELDALAHQPARAWLDPYRSLAAREYRNDIWRNAAGLRRQGAQTLVTAPAALEREVLGLYRMLRARRRV